MTSDICGKCLLKPPQWDRLIIAFDYTATIQMMLKQFKYHRHHAAGRWLSQQLQQQINLRYAHHAPPLHLIPVPIHHTRLRRRGFNQALEIAQYLSHENQLPIDTRCCRRVHHTIPQHTLSATQRKANLKYAFQCKTHPPTRIALVDDILTTGATMQQLTELCRAQGTRWVEVWCLAMA